MYNIIIFSPLLAALVYVTLECRYNRGNTKIIKTKNFCNKAVELEYINIYPKITSVLTSILVALMILDVFLYIDYKIYLIFVICQILVMIYIDYTYKLKDKNYSE